MCKVKLTWHGHVGVLLTGVTTHVLIVTECTFIGGVPSKDVSWAPSTFVNKEAVV